MGVAQVSILVEQVFCRPITVGKGFPDLAIIVDHDGVGQTKFANAPLDVGFVLRKGEFRGVHPDHGESLIAVALVPGLHVREGADAVDASVIPEIDQHDPPAQLSKTKRSGIQPSVPNFRGTHSAFFYSHAWNVSSFSPTSLAQCCTSAWCSEVKAAGKWLSISSSPTTLPCTNTGTTISDLVSSEQAR